MAYGISGATAWNSIEGTAPGGRFRTVESEVSSNSLPLWITMLDSPSRILQFARVAVDKLEGKGIVCTEPVEWLRMPNRASAVTKMTITPSSSTSPSTGASPSSSDPTLGGRPSSAGKASEQYHEARRGLHVQAFMLERSKVDGKPVYQALAELMRHHEVLWISTARGLSGYGEGRKMRGRGWFGKQMDVPITMHIVDVREKLEPLLPEATRLVGGEALLTVTEVALHN